MPYHGAEAIPTTGAGVAITTRKYRNETSLATSPGAFQAFTIHAHAHAVDATTGYMLVDLSDTVHWPHTNTHRILIHNIAIGANPTNTFVGSVAIGFLTDVGTENGNFHIISCTHFIAGGIHIAQTFALPGTQIVCCDGAWFGPTEVNDTTWQLDTNLIGPDGHALYPAGNYDLVLKVTPTASNCDFSVTIVYTTADVAC